jgi:hypothetical protein
MKQLAMSAQSLTTVKLSMMQSAIVDAKSPHGKRTVLFLICTTAVELSNSPV